MAFRYISIHHKEQYMSKSTSKKETNGPKFSCPQQGLYAVSTLASDLLTEHLDLFTKLSPLYGSAYVADVVAEIAGADAMPGQNNRAGRRGSLKVDLLKAKNAGLAKWQDLKGFVPKTWNDPAMQAAKLSAAGANLYNAATGDSQWEPTKKLLQTGADFIKDNRDALIASKAMAKDFESEYALLLMTFSSLWNNYSGLKGNNEVESNAKRKANNDLYDKVIQICKDGRRIFKGDATLQKQFAFAQMLKRVGYGGTAGITATFTYGPNNLPIADVDGVSNDLKYAGLSNAKGILKINRMTEGEHTFTFSAEGFHDLVATVTLQAGVKSRFAFTLQEAVMEVREDNSIAKAA